MPLLELRNVSKAIGGLLILLGLIAIGVMLVAPQGLWGVLQRRFHIELFPIRRRLSVAERRVSAEMDASSASTN